MREADTKGLEAGTSPKMPQVKVPDQFAPFAASTAKGVDPPTPTFTPLSQRQPHKCEEDDVPKPKASASH